MNKAIYIVISFSTFLLGIMLISFQNQWIIIRSPFNQGMQEQKYQAPAMSKKSAVISQWRETKWTKETKEILWPRDKSEQIKNLTAAWLELAHNSHSKKINVQSVILVCKDLDAYLSFSNSPLEKEWSVYQKWHHVESLIKTFKDNGVSLRSIMVLVNHQPLQDSHLDFSQAWPFEGFQNDRQE